VRVAGLVLPVWRLVVQGGWERVGRSGTNRAHLGSRPVSAHTRPPRKDEWSGYRADSARGLAQGAPTRSRPQAPLPCSPRPLLLLQATLLDLSRILAFQARLQQHGVAQYALAVPKHLTQALQGDAAQFAAICDRLEHRVVRPLLPRSRPERCLTLTHPQLKAIATLERDARRAAGLSPARPTSPAPADPPAPVEPAAPGPAAATAAVDEDDVKLPFSLPASSASAPTATTAPPSAAAMQLDLTLSPSPPPAAPSTTTTDSTLPFQLPGSSTLPPSSSAMMLDLTGDDAAPAPVPPPAGGGALDLGGADANADLNALLASLNMPPFDSSASLPGASAAPSLSTAPPPAPPSTAFPALSLDALNALLAGSAPPAASTAPAASQPSALDSLGLSLAPPAPSTVSAAPDLSSLDFSASSFGAFGGDAAGAGPGAAGGAAGGGGGAGLGDGFDFTSFAAAPSAGGAGDASLEELLRSLGGGM